MTIGGSFLVVVLLLAVAPLRRLWLEWSVVGRFLDFIHQGNEPTAYTGLYSRLVTNFGQETRILLGVALLIPAVLGLFVVLYPIALIAWTRRAGWQGIDLFPLFLLAVFLAVVLFAPTAPNGDFTEYQHRPFVLIYQIVAIWTAAYLGRLISDSPATEKPVRVVDALLSIVAISILVGWAAGVEPGRPKFAWGMDFFRVPIERGLVEAADYVRGSAKPGDTVVVAPVNPAAKLIDFAIQFSSLSDVPSYLARPAIHQINPLGRRSEVARERLMRMQEVEAVADAPAAFALLQRICVAWYVHVGAQGPRFDPERAGAAFIASNVATYRVPRSAACERRE